VVVVTALGVLAALSVAELRRLLAHLVWRSPVDPAFTLAWPVRRVVTRQASRRPRSLTGKSVQVRRRAAEDL
jgi:hypothetical protein